MNNYKFTDMIVGMEERFTYEVSEERVEMFKIITNDINPLHTDKRFAIEHGFDNKVVYGMFTAALFSTLGGCYLPGKYCIIEQIESKFVSPVFVGDDLTVVGKVKELNESVQRAVIKVTIFNQKNVKVIRGTMMVGFLEK